MNSSFTYLTIIFNLTIIFDSVILFTFIFLTSGQYDS